MNTTSTHAGISGIVRPARNAAARVRLHDFTARWRQRWGQAATRRLLSGLDDAELRDIGLSRGEIGSVAAELHGAAEATRLQVSRFAIAANTA